jgi:hypothetical protein
MIIEDFFLKENRFHESEDPLLKNDSQISF